MNTVVSATTRFATRNNASGQYMHRAHWLIAEAVTYRKQQRYDLALDSAYQAALRTAAAAVALSPVARRVRKPASAWAQLRLVGKDAAVWADKCEKYSKLRSHALSGITTDIDVAQVDALINLVSEFIDAVETQSGSSPAAA
ncbi:SAV_6107 family HEPN domain-containing protein [Corynebacterium felinum]|uniref:SAV-6107-like HEPN domain-containing protein n=1 Tax=Corynebacterium felinum TaxID=131318 RepID=A0ABU2BC28_9CORY|nr:MULTISPECIES: SAV_6107 family HEPN domain-containing protein [Corynebacterium]MDF5820910.1 SAV_6107 family HEPN domain-containing protein [Corynebacterium felinum]MDO4761448.1 SAV_6107 family HEPN domain-containing protein [Corynebacterium sp.]MDR7356148.1 hypothetical protein [Corynebacterium felinum]WJY95482.1 hypothetical protein CFELI_09390 [Corynebacterium felinum]